MNKNKYLDNTKWILTLLMVMYHIQFPSNGDKSFYNVFMLIKNLGDCVVPAFTIISGFLFWRSVYKFSDLKRKALSRCTSLLIPYILWNILNTALLYFLKSSIAYPSVDLWNNVLCWRSSPHFWYLFMLMFWTVLSPLLYIAYRDKRVLVLLLISQLAYFLMKGNNILSSRFNYILFTWAGLFGSQFPYLFDKICAWGKRQKVLVCIGSWILYFLLYGLYAGKDLEMAIQVWLYGLRAIFLILGAITLPLLPFGKKTNYAYSFWMFAVHYWLDAYVSSYLNGIFTFNPIVGQLFTWSVVLSIGLATGSFMKRWLTWLFNVLTGNRMRTSFLEKKFI